VTLLIVRTLRLTCDHDGCDNTFTVEVADNVPGAVRNTAAQEGWTRTKVTEGRYAGTWDDLCPNHPHPGAKP